MKKKPSALKSINRWYARALKEGRLTNPPLFWRNYDQDYPELRQLEAAYPAIRAECLELLKRHESIPGIETLGGNYTAGGIHTIQWKSFLLKLGSFVNENCQLCPRTTEALEGIPEVYLAFFSILSPRQYIKPHFGYYKGFLRYHLGVLIPENNASDTCWLRINDDPETNSNRCHERISEGKKYYWHDGEGVIFDDSLLHDACNESDDIRVVLWVDLRRPLPRLLDWIHRIVLWAVFKHPYFRRQRLAATLPLSAKAVNQRRGMSSAA